MRTYKEIPYIIYRDADIRHYCAYIRIPEDHSYIKFVRKGYEKVPLDVHGGVTFAKHITQRTQGDWPQGFTTGYWVGWDYAHAGDAIPGHKINLPDSHQWTEAEVEKECQEVIEQLLAAYRLRN